MALIFFTGGCGRHGRECVRRWLRDLLDVRLLCDTPAQSHSMPLLHAAHPYAFEVRPPRPHRPTPCTAGSLYLWAVSTLLALYNVLYEPLTRFGSVSRRAAFRYRRAIQQWRKQRTAVADSSGRAGHAGDDGGSEAGTGIESGNDAASDAGSTSTSARRRSTLTASQVAQRWSTLTKGAAQQRQRVSTRQAGGRAGGRACRRACQPYIVCEAKHCCSGYSGYGMQLWHDDCMKDSNGPGWGQGWGMGVRLVAGGLDSTWTQSACTRGIAVLVSCPSLLSDSSLYAAKHF